MYKVNGQKIREKRKSLKMSQDDLASAVGVSKVTICWYESGERTPGLEHFLKLADILDLSLDEMVGREVSVVCEDEPYGISLPKRDIEIINELKKYPNVYKKLYHDPERTVRLIGKKIK